MFTLLKGKGDLNMSVPYVIEKGKNGNEKVYDLFSRLLVDRIIFIRGAIDQDLADSVVAQLLFLDSTDDSDIFMYINSPGGEVSAMYGVFDTIQYIKSDVTTLGLGTCASAAAFLLCSGVKGKRFALPSTQIMLHELSGGVSGKVGDVKGHYKHMEDLHNAMSKQYSKMTGQPLKKIRRDLERDFYMTPEEAIKYGIIDKVQERKI